MIETTNTDFLKSELLPLIQIDSVKISKQKKRKNSEADKYSVKMSAKVFSAPSRR